MSRLSTFARLHTHRLTKASQSQARIQKRAAANTFRHRYKKIIYILNFNIRHLREENCAFYCGKFLNYIGSYKTKDTVENCFIWFLRRKYAYEFSIKTVAC